MIWRYELVIAEDPDPETIRIAEPPEWNPQTPAEIFDEVSWQYEGRLVDALARLE